MAHKRREALEPALLLAAAPVQVLQQLCMHGYLSGDLHFPPITTDEARRHSLFSSCRAMCQETSHYRRSPLTRPEGTCLFNFVKLLKPWKVEYHDNKKIVEVVYREGLYLLEEVIEELGGCVADHIAAVHIRVLARLGSKALQWVADVKFHLNRPVRAHAILHRPLPKYQRQHIPFCPALPQPLW